MKDFPILCQLIQLLHTYSSKAWNNEESGQYQRTSESSRALRKFLKKVSCPMKIDDMTEFFSTLKEQKKADFVLQYPIHLLPPRSDMDYIPLLHLECWSSQKPPKMNIRIGMYRFDDKYNTQGIGFRYESAHLKGAHTYNHVQLCPKPFNSEKLNNVLNHPTWLPAGAPAFILPGDNLVTFFLSVIVSLYGKEAFVFLRGVNIDKKYFEPVEVLF